MPVHVADDGCRIHCQLDGNGPPCLLIPGLGGEAGFWQGVASTLENDYRLIRIDHRAPAPAIGPRAAIPSLASCGTFWACWTICISRVLMSSDIRPAV